MASRQIKTQNPSHGFHGEMVIKHGTEGAGKQYAKFHSRVQTITGVTATKARDFLDSTYGKHLGDAANAGAHHTHLRQHIVKAMRAFDKAYDPEDYKNLGESVGLDAEPLVEIDAGLISHYLMDPAVAGVMGYGISKFGDVTVEKVKRHIQKTHGRIKSAVRHAVGRAPLANKVSRVTWDGLKKHRPANDVDEGTIQEGRPRKHPLPPGHEGHDDRLGIHAALMRHKDQGERGDGVVKFANGDKHQLLPHERDKALGKIRQLIDSGAKAVQIHDFVSRLDRSKNDFDSLVKEDVTSDEILEILNEKIFDSGKYKWYRYNHSEPTTVERKGLGPVTLSKGDMFGVRPATSSNTHRLVAASRGLSHVYTIPNADVPKYLAKSKELREGFTSETEGDTLQEMTPEFMAKMKKDHQDHADHDDMLDHMGNSGFEREDADEDSTTYAHDRMPEGHRIRVNRDSTWEHVNYDTDNVVTSGKGVKSLEMHVNKTLKPATEDPYLKGITAKLKEASPAAQGFRAAKADDVERDKLRAKLKMKKVTPGERKEILDQLEKLEGVRRKDDGSFSETTDYGLPIQDGRWAVQIHRGKVTNHDTEAAARAHFEQVKKEKLSASLYDPHGREVAKRVTGMKPRVVREAVDRKAFRKAQVDAVMALQAAQDGAMSPPKSKGRDTPEKKRARLAQIDQIMKLQADSEKRVMAAVIASRNESVDTASSRNKDLEESVQSVLEGKPRYTVTFDDDTHHPLANDSDAELEAVMRRLKKPADAEFTLYRDGEEIGAGGPQK